MTLTCPSPSVSLTKPVIIHLQLTFHRGALRTCGGHHHHPHTRPSAVWKVLWAVLFTHHLHKGTTLHVLWWLHGSVPLNSLPLSWSAVRERDRAVSLYMGPVLTVQSKHFSCCVHYSLLNSDVLHNCAKHDKTGKKSSDSGCN